MRTIIIVSEGFIETKGVYGPVLSPYKETDKEIRKMLARGVKIVEILEDGTHVNVTRLAGNEPVKCNHVKKETVVVEKPQAPKIQPHREKRHLKKDKKNKFKPDFEIDTFEAK